MILWVWALPEREMAEKRAANKIGFIKDDFSKGIKDLRIMFKGDA